MTTPQQQTAFLPLSSQRLQLLKARLCPDSEEATLLQLLEIHQCFQVHAPCGLGETDQRLVNLLSDHGIPFSQAVMPNGNICISVNPIAA